MNFVETKRSATNSKQKHTKRHLAALDFLLSIPMAREEDIISEGQRRIRLMREQEESGMMDGATLGNGNGAFNSLQNDEESLPDQAQDTYNQLLNADTSRRGSNSDLIGGSSGGGGLTGSNTANGSSANPAVGANGASLYEGIFDSSVGKKLRGPDGPVLSIPLQFRYQIDRITESNASIRQWEDYILVKGYFNEAEQSLNTPINGRSPYVGASGTRQSGIALPATAVTTTPSGSGRPPVSNQSQQPILSSRLFFAQNRSYPITTVSIIKYDAGEEQAKLRKLKLKDSRGFEVYRLPERDWRGLSYKPLFKPLAEERTGEYFHEKGFMYDPDQLDDPTHLHGSHRHVLQSSAYTGPVLSSVILYVNEKELKTSLNEAFRNKHPNLPPSLTLSRIRKIKKKILIYCVSIELELSTIALGMINFERLCLKNLVSKSNNHISMALSILLAYKFSETPMGPEYKKKLDALFYYFDDEWDLPKTEILKAEFGAYVQLGFSLFIPFPHLYEQYCRLLKLLHKTSRQYIGEEMEQFYRADMIQFGDKSHEYEEDD